MGASKVVKDHVFGKKHFSLQIVKQIKAGIEIVVMQNWQGRTLLSPCVSWVLLGPIYYCAVPWKTILIQVAAAVSPSVIGRV